MKPSSVSSSSPSSSASYLSRASATQASCIAASSDFWRNDAGFFDSATSNKWEGVLTDDDLSAYDAAISKLLSPEQRQWLEWGEI